MGRLLPGLDVGRGTGLDPVTLLEFLPAR
jgi:hypothetical protein